MKTITVSEFRKNIKKYADLAKKEKVIVSRGEGRAFAIVPLEEVDDSGYNPEFVKKILKAKENIKEGQFTLITNAKDIWKDIL